MTKKQPTKPILCNTNVMADASGLSSTTLRKLRHADVFKSKIHWCHMPNSDRILWNHDLVIDAIVHGSDSPKHQMAIEKFKSGLTSSDDYQPSGA